MSYPAMADPAWPPKSPRDALLSSPGGRRKYEDLHQRRKLLSSPLKRSNTTPGLRTKAQQILDEDPADDDSEEDEETLQLKLAEIQARLKLKQLQKNRARSGTTSSSTEDGEVRSSRPSSATVSSEIASQIVPPKSPRGLSRNTPHDDIQVPLSPTRREQPSRAPWSPQRCKMGIDKGWTAADVSLKRAPRPTSQLETRSAATARSGDVFSSRPQSSPSTGGLSRIKSFSERMAEGRAAEKLRAEKAKKIDRIRANRSAGFQLDKAEIDAFKSAAAKEPASSPNMGRREPQAPAFTREDILKSVSSSRTGVLKRSQTTSSLRSDDRNSFTGRPTEDTTRTDSKPDPSKFESYSGLHLSNRILPHSFLSRSLADKHTLKIPDLLKTVKAPAFELPETIDGDFVVFGIVASKSDTKQTKDSGKATSKSVEPLDDGMNNTNSYMVMTLTDLQWTIDLFLFDTAFPRYYKISEGTVVAILNPTVMPPPKHKLDTNRFSLCLSSSDDKVLEIGKAQDIGFCKSVRKDGKICQAWVDSRKTEFCDFHVDLQVRRTQGSRSGVNSGTGMFGGGGKSGSRTGIWQEGRGHSRGGSRSGAVDSPSYRSDGKLKAEGAQYHMGTQSVYYVAPGPRNGGASRTSYNPAAVHSTASLLDASDDPFIAAGMMERGMENKEERMRRRLVAQQRELEITRKLISGRAGGVGVDYLRTRTANETDQGKKGAEQTAPSTPDSTRPSQGLNLVTYGRANNVRLSPMKRAHDGDKPHGSGVKKTRFLTSKGIREAGRDSLGGDATPVRRVLSDDEGDDDLEFV
ncbi:hypothetical protein N7539_001941 [Penicillium diatomitis]|uniref:Zinc finger Mcm10/DnaG-type domain-containing protein n=1 Tax=Penicillium diatomitis TaxID=2819901 RepID=A0A9X0C0K2_9EURO|nr:uncharacterized protein N7539_001941 [Penicillium diatomitis]KAJ5493195.1 hypothetical protein N7539_001941 [Penicillium diatomitis]